MVGQSRMEINSFRAQKSKNPLLIPCLTGNFSGEGFVGDCVHRQYSIVRDRRPIFVEKKVDSDTTSCKKVVQSNLCGV